MNDQGAERSGAATSVADTMISPRHREGKSRAGNLGTAAGIRFERGESMQLKFLFAMVMAFALSLGAIAQQQNDSGIKQDTKDAAHSTGKAVKKTGHKIKKGTKKVVHKSATATRKGAEKVEDKSSPTPTPPPQK
jgi:hypothetical protein